MVLDEEDDARFDDIDLDGPYEGLLPATARSEMFFAITAGRCGSVGSAGRERSR
jgi:hypothetical protein